MNYIDVTINILFHSKISDLPINVLLKDLRSCTKYTVFHCITLATNNLMYRLSLRYRLCIWTKLMEQEMFHGHSYNLEVLRLDFRIRHQKVFCHRMMCWCWKWIWQYNHMYVEMAAFYQIVNRSLGACPQITIENNTEMRHRKKNGDVF